MRKKREKKEGDRPRTDVPQWVEKKYKEEEDAATVVSKALSWQSAMNECARGLVASHRQC